jgi:hypothetical protein
MIQRHDFPAQLSEYVRDKWQFLVADDIYRLPPLPGPAQLLSLLEVAYLASLETDEARPLRFTLCCTPQADRILRHNQNVSVEVWPFSADRPFTIQEIRRLAAATDLDNSAIWVRFPPEPDAPLSIHGIVGLGSSWAAARHAFAYRYESLPEALLVQVPAPGQVIVYQGQFLLASLQSGQIQGGELPSPVGLLGAYPLFEEGHGLLREEITAPQYQPHEVPALLPSHPPGPCPPGVPWEKGGILPPRGPVLPGSRGMGQCNVSTKMQHSRCIIEVTPLP